jgi:hypothetical protein
MQANTTGIRQSFSDMRLRWNNAKLKKSRVFWIVIGVLFLTLFLGFTRGGWTTDTSANLLADKSAKAAVVDRLATICVAQFGADSQGTSKLEELKALSASQRNTYVKEQGWATMPGETTPDNRVAAECASQLAKIGE